MTSTSIHNAFNLIPSHSIPFQFSSKFILKFRKNPIFNFPHFQSNDTKTPHTKVPVCVQNQCQDVSCMTKSYASYYYSYYCYAIEHLNRRRRVNRKKIARQMQHEQVCSVYQHAESVLCFPRSGTTTTIRSVEKRERKNR